jgi:hypothetical protein
MVDFISKALQGTLNRTILNYAMSTSWSYESMEVLCVTMEIRQWHLQEEAKNCMITF